MNDHDKNRKNGEELPEEIELTASEKEALDSLPRDRIPEAALEERVVGALRERGFLVQPRHRVIELTAWRFAAAAAACLVLLATGFVLGQRTGSPQLPSDDPTLHANNDLYVAASVQQAGSAYLLALERLAGLPESVDSQQAVQGREVALTTLCTAADQVTRLVPRSVLAGQLLAALDSDSDVRTAEERGEATIEGNRVIEF